MAIDSKQKRMSAIMPLMPFRGPLVDAIEVGFTQGNRQASIYTYSAILATILVVDRISLERGGFCGVGTGVLSGQF